MSKNYVIGLDFGTDSVRSLLVDADTGKSLASSVHRFKRWGQGLYCLPLINQFRQHTMDHLEGMESVIQNTIKCSGVYPNHIKGICVDTTGSSPVPLDQNGTPLSLTHGFKENPNAMTILWKDHTSITEADEINFLARNWRGEDYTKWGGGIYSSEWFWAKILHISRIDNAVKQAAHTWMEQCDLMTYILIGSPPLNSFRRSRCAAGHKAMWHQSWGGLPSDSFLCQLDPYLVEVKNQLYEETYTSDKVAGKLSPEWADKLGLSQDTIIAVGTFDAHAGAVGAQVEAGTLVRVMGTSTCDITVTPRQDIDNKTVKGICGQVDGSVMPGMIGLEAGQSAFGDVLAWFKDTLILAPAEIIRNSEQLDNGQKKRLIEELHENMISTLTNMAEATPLNESAPLALDWINGRRTPDADQTLKAAIISLNLGTKAPHLFRALVEAICFGSRRIIDRFEEEGIPITSVVGIGGVAKKSPFVMQTLADVLNRPIKIAKAEQASALGAAMYAATAAGIFASVEDAIKAMGQGVDKTYTPNKNSVDIYNKLYNGYLGLGSYIKSLKSL